VSPAPPRLAEALIRAALPPVDRQAVLGDLAEEFAVRAVRDGRRSAGRWYWRQAGTSVLPSIRRRLTDAVPDRPGRDGPSRVMAGLLRDVRDAARSLRSTPGLTVTALCVLTLGIGAGTAIYSVVDAVVLRGLPFEHSDRLLAPAETWKGREGGGVIPQDFLDWQARQGVFEDLAAITGPGEAFRLPASDRRYQALHVTRVTTNLFAALGVRPRLGRTFTADDALEGRQHVAVISDAFWRAQFGADPHVVGRTLRLTNGPWEIVGVMPPGFTYPVDTVSQDLWVPYVMAAAERIRGRRNMFNAYLHVVGRVKPGVTVEQARAEVHQIMTSLSAEDPAWFSNVGVTVPTLKESIVGSTLRSWMLMFLGAVGCVLLMAAVNVATLLLARATVRSREIGIRAALGASRWRLVRGLLVESLTLALAGTALGVALAYWGVDVVRTLLPAGLPRADLIAVNVRVLAAASLAAVTTGLACGLAPALQGSGPNLVDTLREGGRSATASPGRQRLRAALVIAEVSLATVLVVGSGLFVFSFARLMEINVGLDYHHVLTVGVYPRIDTSTRQPPQADLDRAAVVLTDMAERVRGLPGVAGASVLDGGLPLSNVEFVDGITVPGRDPRPSDTIEVYRVTPEYPTTLRIPLLRGRLFTGADNRPGSAPVVLLNDVAARQYLAGREALGATVGLGLEGDRTVVGIVGGTRTDGPETDVRPEAYVPVAQGGIRSGYLMIRTNEDPGRLVAPIAAIVTAVAPQARIGTFQTLDSLFSGLVARRRFNMVLVGLFGVLAIAIASVGIYGVVSYLVEQRTQEIGVRLALGAVPSGIVRMVLGRSAGVVGAGVVIGLVGAWALARFARAFLFQVQPHDPLIYLLMSALLFVTGLTAAAVPARRAARVDPLDALRTT
jgi:putative ABC transport system permease protein